MTNQYEVLGPWAEADPVPFQGITPRVADLAGKTIGLFCSAYKPASAPILRVVEDRLKKIFSTSKFTWFDYGFNQDLKDTGEVPRFEDWVKGVDAVVAAVGD